MPTTEFAPAERATDQELKRQTAAVRSRLEKETLAESVPALLLILNEQRQIVYANENVCRLLNLTEMGPLCGMRPGEALHCIRAAASELGCGTTAFCRACGAVQAILTALGGIPDRRECRLLSEDGQAMDLMVWATPSEYNGDRYVILSVQDVGDEKRRRALEQVFFHDVLNSAFGLRGLGEVLDGTPREELREMGATIQELAERLIDEIEAQRDLASAERHELKVHPVRLRSMEILDAAMGMVRSLAVRREVELAVEEGSADGEIAGDRVLLRRVLGNLLKNAVEATRCGGTVSARCTMDEHTVEFAVHNEGTLTESARLQVFQRSFSTKGEGRGLGTYGARLLTEGYMKGTIAFWSEEGEGTTFAARYPRWG